MFTSQTPTAAPLPQIVSFPTARPDWADGTREFNIIPLPPPPQSDVYEWRVGDVAHSVALRQVKIRCLCDKQVAWESFPDHYNNPNNSPNACRSSYLNTALLGVTIYTLAKALGKQSFNIRDSESGKIILVCRLGPASPVTRPLQPRTPSPLNLADAMTVFRNHMLPPDQAWQQEQRRLAAEREQRQRQAWAQEQARLAETERQQLAWQQYYQRQQMQQQQQWQRQQPQPQPQPPRTATPAPPVHPGNQRQAGLLPYRGPPQYGSGSYAGPPAGPSGYNQRQGGYGRGNNQGGNNQGGNNQRGNNQGGSSGRGGNTR